MSERGSTVIELKPVYQGDTWLGLKSVTIQIDDVAVDLTGSSIEMHMRTRPDHATVVKAWSIEESSIVITDASNGIFRVNGAVMNIPPKKYFWSVQITLSSGRKLTVLHGSLCVNSNPTHHV